MERRRFLAAASAVFVASLLPHGSLMGQEASADKIPLLVLPGYRNTTQVDWLIQAKPILSGFGIEATGLSLPPNDFPDRNFCLSATHAAVMSFPGQVDLVGFSMGGGLVQMYLHDFEPLDEEGNSKIRRAVIISARDLFRYTPAEAPVGLRPFYKQLTDPERVTSKAEEIRVAYGLRDQQVRQENGENLAAMFGVTPYVFDVDHGGIVDDPYMLFQVVR